MDPPPDPPLTIAITPAPTGAVCKFFAHSTWRQNKKVLNFSSDHLLSLWKVWGAYIHLYILRICTLADRLCKLPWKTLGCIGWFPERRWKLPWKTLGRIGRFPERRRSIFQRENEFLLLNNHLRLSGNRLIHPHVFQGCFQHLSGNHKALVQGLGSSDGASIVHCRFLSLQTRP